MAVKDDPDRKFWETIRRALMMAVGAIDSRYGFKAKLD